MGRLRQWVGLALCISAITLVLAWIGTPSPPLFGSLLGASAFAFITSSVPAEHRPSIPRSVFLVAQATVGLMVGAQVDLDALQAFGSDWPAILGVTLATLVASTVSGLALCRYGVNAATGVFSTIAGGASGMSAIADDLGADARVVAVIQYLRVLIVLVTLPTIVALVFSPDRGDPIGSEGAVSGGRAYLFVVVAIILGIAVGKAAHFPSPAVLGGSAGRARTRADAVLRRCRGPRMDRRHGVRHDRRAGRTAVHRSRPWWRSDECCRWRSLSSSS